MLVLPPLLSILPSSSRPVRCCMSVLLLVGLGVMSLTSDANAERESSLKINIPSLPKDTAKVDVVDNNLAVRVLDVQMDTVKLLNDFPKEVAPVSGPVSGQVAIGKAAKPIASHKPPAEAKAKPMKAAKAEPRKRPKHNPAVVLADDKVPLPSGSALSGLSPAAGALVDPVNIDQVTVRVQAESYSQGSQAASILNHFPTLRPAWMNSTQEALAVMRDEPIEPVQAQQQPQPTEVYAQINPLEDDSQVEMTVSSVQSGLRAEDMPKAMSASVERVTSQPPKPSSQALPASSIDDPQVASAAQELSQTLERFDPFTTQIPQFSSWQMNPPIKQQAAREQQVTQATTVTPAAESVAESVVEPSVEPIALAKANAPDVAAPPVKVPDIQQMVQSSAIKAKKEAIQESIELAKAEALAELEPAGGSASGTAQAVMSPASSVSLSRESKALLAKVPSQIDSPRPARGEVKIDRETTNIVAYSQMATEVEAEHESFGMKIELRRPVLDVNEELTRAYDAVVAGQNGMAMEGYERVLKVQPNHLNALYGKATLLHQAGDIASARAYYQRILAKDPDHREALNNFLSLVAEEAPQEALEELYKLQKKNPYFSPIPAQISNIFQKLGDYRSAIAAMQDAYELAPGNLTYTLNMAVLLDRAGAKPQAADYYQQLVDAQMGGQEIPGNINVIQERLTFLRSNR